MRKPKLSSSRLKESKWRRWLLLAPLVAVLALSACRAETEQAFYDVVRTEPDGADILENILRSKVTLDNGEQGRGWYEACPSRLRAYRCLANFKRVTHPVEFGPTPKQGGPFGPFDFKRKMFTKMPPCDTLAMDCDISFYRLCGDVMLNGRRTAPVCWDARGKAEGPQATDGNYDAVYGWPTAGTDR